MKYKAIVHYEETRSGICAWIEGYSYRPSDNGPWDNGFVPTHPEHGEAWAFKEACRRAKECACAILDGEDSEVNFEVLVEREDVEKENLDQEEYDFIDAKDIGAAYPFGSDSPSNAAGERTLPAGEKL